jgi:hypothetical protein
MRKEFTMSENTNHAQTAPAGTWNTENPTIRQIENRANFYHERIEAALIMMLHQNKVYVPADIITSAAVTFAKSPVDPFAEFRAVYVEGISPDMDAPRPHFTPQPTCLMSRTERRELLVEQARAAKIYARSGDITPEQLFDAEGILINDRAADEPVEIPDAPPVYDESGLLKD